MLRRRSSLITAVAAIAVLVAGCADSGYHYVKSSADKTYFKVPDRWTLFDEDAVLDELGGDLTEDERESVRDQLWQVVFDAAPKPSIDHVGHSGSTHPSGTAVVRELSADDADVLSTSTLRNYFVDLDKAIEESTAEVLAYEELKPEGGFRGLHLVADLVVGGKSIVVDQTVLVDQATTKLYALLVSCSNVCYEDNRSQIKNVVESWTVRAK